MAELRINNGAKMDERIKRKVLFINFVPLPYSFVLTVRERTQVFVRVSKTPFGTEKCRTYVENGI